jgi:adenylate cyclase
MRAARHALSEEWAEQGRPRLKARTGINTGLMLVGNLGSKYRFSYGVLGDNVNLGSRLEGLNKEYGTEIILGQNTADAVRTSFVLREIDLVRAVGKQAPTRIYELMAAIGPTLPAQDEALLAAYAAGLAAYREARWTDALRSFGEALKRRPGDGPSSVMSERCRAYLQSPPGADWDGVFVATRK